MHQEKLRKRGKHNTELPCTKCGEIKPVSEFYFQSDKDIYKTVCKTCLVLERKRWNHSENGKASRKKSHLMRMYGLTDDEFRGMITYQENKCDICENPFLSQSDICVDHDHATGAVRSLLCRACNLLIGSCVEDRRILVKAIYYLDKYK